MLDWPGSVFFEVDNVAFTLLSLTLPLLPATGSDWPPAFSEVCMYLGFRIEFKDGWIRSSYSVKLNKGGSSRPFGNRVPCSRSSSKKGWAHASNGVIRPDGVYSRRPATNSIASGGVRALNTWNYTQITLLSPLLSLVILYIYMVNPWLTRTSLEYLIVFSFFFFLFNFHFCSRIEYSVREEKI